MRGWGAAPAVTARRTCSRPAARGRSPFPPAPTPGVDASGIRASLLLRCQRRRAVPVRRRGARRPATHHHDVGLSRLHPLPFLSTMREFSRAASPADLIQINRVPGLRRQATVTGILPIFARHSRGPVSCTALPFVSTATVTGNYRLTDANADSDVRHIILDFGDQKFPVLEGQSIGIVAPGLDADGKPHVARLYSVASPRGGEKPNTNNLALTVKREDGGTV